MRTIVDPRFGMELKARRQAAGLSQRALAPAAYIAKSQISEYESGRRHPSALVASNLDRALNAGGALAALVVERPRDGEADDRIGHALVTPRQIDEATVEALAGMLARSRHLDDSLPAAMLLPTVETDLQMVLDLAREARGPHAPALRLVVAEWEQFAGWMNAQVRRDSRAASLLEAAAQDALALGAADLSSQAHNFRGALERWKGNPRGIARYFMAAAEVPGASDMQRVDAMVQAVQGLGMMGDRREATRLLQEADDMTTAVDGRAGDGEMVSAYWLTPSWLRLPIGLAHLGLRNFGAAADNLVAGLEALPDTMESATWTAEYRGALDLARDGGRDDEDQGQGGQAGVA